MKRSITALTILLICALTILPFCIGSYISGPHREWGFVDITIESGVIDSATIGATTPSTGSFTTLKSTAGVSTIKADYDVTGGDSGTVAAHDLGVTIPDNAVVIRAVIEVITAFDSAAHGETIALGIATNDTAGILAAADLGSTGFKASIQDDGLAANYSEKTTAERQLIATVAGEAATSGKLLLWVEYIISE